MKNEFEVYCDCCLIQSICCDINLLCGTFLICKECLEETLRKGFPNDISTTRSNVV